MPGLGCPGGTCPSVSGPGARCGSGTTGSAWMAPTTRSMLGSWLRPTRPATWTGCSRSTPRSIGRTSTPRTCLAPSDPRAVSQGVEENYTLRGRAPGNEPVDHAIGRSRGGLSTKIHQLVDGQGRPLVIALTAGHAGDSPVLKMLLADLAVHRIGPGRPRTRPEALLGHKAYSSRANRDLLRRKRTKAVIPQRADEVGHWLRRGATGGRPPTFDPEAYKGRNVVERSFNDDKQWRGIATRYDKLAAAYRGLVVLRAITLWLRE